MPSVFNTRRHSNLPTNLSEKQPIEDPIRRASIVNMDFLRSKDKRTKSAEKLPGAKSNKSHVPAKLEIEMESPPLVMYGQRSQSTGALMSGQILLTVLEESVTLEDFDMSLDIVMVSKKPVVPKCPDCESRKTNIHKWTMIKHPTTYKKGVHKFPFSELLDGKMPATTDGQMGKIDYVLHPIAHTSTPPPGVGSITIETSRNLTVMRALNPNTLDHQSTRVFPPTKLNLVMSLPPFVHAIGDFNAQLRITGLHEEKDDHLTRWRVRKITYRIDEASQIISLPCAKHAKIIGAKGGQYKGIKWEDAKTLLHKEFREGWKTDYSAPEGGSIEFEFPFNMSKATSHTPQCDVELPDGVFQIKHVLVLEMIVSEEIAQKKRGSGDKEPKYLPTGSARIMRTQFNVPVTERSGLGISWDEEQPPVYEDVPHSPPHYAHVLDYEGEELREQI